MRILFKLTGMQFKILLRNRTLLVSSIGLAVISMLIFGALFGNNNAQPLSLGVVDLDRSGISAQVVAGMAKSNDLNITEGAQAALVAAMQKGQYAAVVVIQPGFGAGLLTNTARVTLFVDESNLIGAGRSRALVATIFDTIGKRVAGFQDPIQIAEQRVAVRAARQIDFLTPGMLGVTIMFANMAAGILLLSWRERGTLKRLAATPLRAWQLIGAQILSQMVLSFVQVAVLLALGVAVFNIQFSAAWLPSIAVFVVAGAFSIISLSYALGNFIQKPEAAESMATLISLPMMFLGGSYFQVTPPAFLQPLVTILPLTHLNQAFRQIMLDGAGVGSLLLDLGALLACGAILFAFSIRTFRWSWSK